MSAPACGRPYVNSGIKAPLQSVTSWWSHRLPASRYRLQAWGVRDESGKTRPPRVATHLLYPTDTGWAACVVADGAPCSMAGFYLWAFWDPYSR
jgi:hypothetical protein